MFDLCGHLPFGFCQPSAPHFCCVQGLRLSAKGWALCTLSFSLAPPRHTQYRGAWLRCPHWCCCYCHVLSTCSVPMPGSSCWPWLLGAHIFPGTIPVRSKASGCLESTVKSLQMYLGEEKPFTPHSRSYKLTRLHYYNDFIHRTWSSQKIVPMKNKLQATCLFLSGSSPNSM